MSQHMSRRQRAVEALRRHARSIEGFRQVVQNRYPNCTYISIDQAAVLLADCRYAWEQTGQSDHDCNNP